MASLTIGPVGRNPDRARGEHQYAFIVGEQTASLVDAGGGELHTVVVGVAGTLAKFYDAAEGASLSADNQIATVSLAAVTSGPLNIGVAFSRGLQCVVTGASAELTVAFDGAQTVSPLTFP
jgi:hypothetical protein